MTRWKPIIRRVWLAREGRFAWQATQPPRTRAGGALRDDLYLERQADIWCGRHNRRDK